MLLLVIRVVASAVGMKMLSSLLGTIIDVGFIAVIIIFQPEIRRFLNTLGRSAGDTLEKRSFIQKLWARDALGALSAASIAEISQAVQAMAEQKTGALIVIRRKDALQDILATGDMLDAAIRSRLIMNIFFKNSPLHDGAMVLGGNRIEAARCTLPISDNGLLPARYGMRHKAAVGITERSDAFVVVVSEQSGEISVAERGRLETVHSLNALKLRLQQLS